MAEHVYLAMSVAIVLLGPTATGGQFWEVPPHPTLEIS